MAQDDQDILKSIFSRMSEETLPPAFQTEMMQQIRKEALRIAKRSSRLQILALLSAILFTIGLAGAALVYLGVPQLTNGFPQIQVTPFPQFSFPSYYVSFGFLVLILLFADFFLRQIYYRKH